ncbi:E3 ubiquitin-protein ligase RNF38 isoform 4-T6 [Podargus strigoides]
MCFLPCSVGSLQRRRKLKKSEDSPSPKRQRLSHSVFDYTAASPAPSPPMRPWEMTSNRQPPLARPNQHHFSGERCNTPARNRRSPPVRRQRTRRDRLSRHNSINQDENYHHLSYGQQQAIEEPRAFHPPNVSPRMLHPAAHPPQQNAVVVDIHDQMLQACSVQHLPVPYAAFPPLISSDPFLLHPPRISPHHSPHLPPPGQFVPFQAQQSRSPLQRIENEVELLGEHLPVGGFTYPPSAHPPTLPPSAPLQFLTHDPLHQEVSFGVPYPPFMPRRLTGRSRYRSQQPIPPHPYHPSLLPYVLSMFPVPPAVGPAFSFELDVEDGEVENYEALLNLAERLGEAKPRGLTKADIEQLPSYRFNPNNHQSEQTLQIVPAPFVELMLQKCIVIQNDQPKSTNLVWVFLVTLKLRDAAGDLGDGGSKLVKSWKELCCYGSSLLEWFFHLHGTLADVCGLPYCG